MKNKHKKFSDIITFSFIVIISLVFFIPVLATLTNSLMTESEIVSRYSGSSFNGSGFFGLNRGFGIIPYPISFDQFKKVLITDYRYIFMFWQSLLITTIATLFNVIISILSGFALGKIEFRFNKILFSIYLIVLFMPFSVTLLPNYLLIRWLNIFDSSLALILPAIFAPLGVLFIAGFSKSISEEYFEAARLETNNFLNILLYVIIPILRPAISALIVITFAENWSMIEQPLILLSDPLKYPLSLALNSVSHTSSAFAAAVIYFIPIIILFLFFEDEMITELINLGGSINVKQ